MRSLWPFQFPRPGNRCGLYLPARKGSTKQGVETKSWEGRTLSDTKQNHLSVLLKHNQGHLQMQCTGLITNGQLLGCPHAQTCARCWSRQGKAVRSFCTGECPTGDPVAALQASCDMISPRCCWSSGGPLELRARESVIEGRKGSLCEGLGRKDTRRSWRLGSSEV